jgi:hypothetical protein
MVLIQSRDNYLRATLSCGASVCGVWPTSRRPAIWRACSCSAVSVRWASSVRYCSTPRRRCGTARNGGNSPRPRRACRSWRSGSGASAWSWPRLDGGVSFWPRLFSSSFCMGIIGPSACRCCHGYDSNESLRRGRHRRAWYSGRSTARRPHSDDSQVYWANTKGHWRIPLSADPLSGV